MLKLNPRGHRDDRWVAGEGDALAFYEPTGAVAGLLGQRDDGFTLLLERLEPGTPLDQTALSWEQRLECSASWLRGCTLRESPATRSSR